MSVARLPDTIDLSQPPTSSFMPLHLSQAVSDSTHLQHEAQGKDARTFLLQMHDLTPLLLMILIMEDFHFPVDDTGQVLAVFHHPGNLLPPPGFRGPLAFLVRVAARLI